MFRRQLIKMAALSSFALSVATAQSTTVNGIVLGPDGQPVPNADVVMIHSARRLTFTAITDSSGRFHINNIPTGTYTVRATNATNTPLTGQIPEIAIPSEQDVVISISIVQGRGGGAPGGGKGKGAPGGGGRGGTRPIPARGILLHASSEDTGYGLYSYLLFGSQPNTASRPRYEETLKGYLQILPPLATLALPRNQINITYAPVTDGVVGFDLQTQTTAQMESLRDHYDYGRASGLLARLGGGPLLNGPYLASVLTPLSTASQPPQHVLFQDLTSIPITLIAPWIKHFMTQAATEQFWEDATISRFVLELRTGIEVVALAIPDVKAAYSDWKSVLASLIKVS
jgi:Carboxypeptidase regulatory-like domain